MKTTIVTILLFATSSDGAENFTGPAAAVKQAETAREELAVYWFGAEMPKWFEPCPIKITKSQSGRTWFRFSTDEDGRRHVSGWRMECGSTAIRHEVNHAVFATHFRRELPRWIDEGAATFIETEEETKRIRIGLQMNIKADRFTHFSELFKNSGKYPRGGTKLANLYGEGHAIVEYLIANGGRAKFIKFVGDVKVDTNGASTLAALSKHYGIESAAELERAWFASKPAGKIAHKQQCRLVVYSSPTCPPCCYWKHRELGRIKAAGIDVEIVEDHARARSAGVRWYPTFVVVRDGRERDRLFSYQTASKIIKAVDKCEASTSIPAPPIGSSSSSGIAALAESIRELGIRLKSLEDRPESIDLSELRAIATELGGRLTVLESIEIPVRIETSTGKLIREKRYNLERDDEGRLIFKPIVLKFDEELLRGK
jgi:hypothetical protein